MITLFSSSNLSMTTLAIVLLGCTSCIWTLSMRPHLHQLYFYILYYKTYKTQNFLLNLVCFLDPKFVKFPDAVCNLLQKKHEKKMICRSLKSINLLWGKTINNARVNNFNAADTIYLISGISLSVCLIYVQ